MPVAPFQIGPILPWLRLFGIAVLSATGAVAAARREQAFVTLAFFALVAGVGGGTIRALLIGAPVFWVHDTRVAGLCLAVAAAMWFTPQRWWTTAAFDWLDAAGLGAPFAVGGGTRLGSGGRR